MIWVGDSGESLLKVVQEVAGSQHCAQVCPLTARVLGSGVNAKNRARLWMTTHLGDGTGTLSKDSC